MIYRFSLLYILFCTIAWCIYFLISDINAHSRIIWSSMIVALITIMALWFTNTNMYRDHYNLTSILTAIALCTIGLSFLCFTGYTFSSLGHFALCLEILLLIYAFLPMVLWIRVVIAVSYSILFETLSSFVPGNLGVHGTNPVIFNRVLILRILLHFSVHLMAIHVFVMRNVRMRGTFIKIGQNLLFRRHLEMEKNLKENMVHCMMPPKVADILLNESGSDQPVAETKLMKVRSFDNVKSLFRPFYMYRMHNVSILFADIVGFTAISSKKTAEQLVEILNDLYKRFDDLCTFSGCEKIATLGDCYYCVSGCPEPRPDHAHCCVELGLEMVYAMQYFKEQQHEGIKMRVGIHTGTVLCGIVGTRRAKFDVWSNDVKMANLMESSGEPERVHISEATRNYLGDDFLLEDGEEVMGQRTYFVTGRKIQHFRNSSLIENQIAIVHSNNGTLSSIDLLNSEPFRPPSDETIVEQIHDTSPATMIESPGGSYSSYIVDNPPNPERRPRVSLLAAAKHDTTPSTRNISPLPSGSLNYFHYDILSLESSRKNSDIKSNSRRPSIQQQIHAHNQTTAILQPGYFTSSLVNINLEKSPVPGIPTRPLANPLAEFLQYLQRQADIQLLRCFQDNAESQEINLLRPPLKRFTLFFKSKQIEREFRSNAHRFGTENETEGPRTLARPPYSTCLDIFVCIVVYFCVAASILLISPQTLTYWNYWLVIFSIFTSTQLFALMYCTQQLCRRKIAKYQTIKKSYGGIFAAINSWYSWRICLALLLTMPVVLIIFHYALLDLNQLQAFEYHYGFLIFVSIVHFCNFTHLNFWMRNILALLGAIGFIFIAYNQMTDHKNQSNLTNGTKPMITITERILLEEVKWFSEYFFETYIDVLLLLIFVWLLNRELEIGYRVTFYGDEVAKQEKIRVLDMKNQVEMLLHNIMPQHVVEHLKNYGKYSENHRNVAIIFASIVNFDDIYEESSMGGQEYLQVLNELIGDFDDQLSRPEFQCIEKIKLIGSTYMAASGLDSLQRQRYVRNHHIYALFEFSKSMQLAVSSFNKKLFELEFILKIGFNVGDATTGVIGTIELQYDIWGDTVNVASRMNSTGVKGRIQVGKNCLPYLEDRYEFERRGEVYVKGKGNMEVFLYTRDKPHLVENDCYCQCECGMG